MKKIFKISKEIEPFDKKIEVDGDKSLSIRWGLLASLAKGKSTAYNLPRSEDVMSTLKCLRKIGISVNLKRKKCIINGKGINFKPKKKIILNAGNSGTLGRLILGMNANFTNKLKLIGDRSLSRRDFSRIINPLKKFGVRFSSKKNFLPITMTGSNYLKPIKYFENRGSAQCKSSVMFAALKTKGTCYIKAKKSRDHTELLFKYLNLPLKIRKTKKYDFIKIKGVKKIKSLNYNIPGDISSSAFFIVLTILSKKSKILIKNINVNSSRTGLIEILKKMGAKINIKNKKKYKGETVGDILVKSSKNLKSINCPVRLNSKAIDEFLIIFLVAAKSRGVSHFKNLSELNKKESPRLKWGAKILNLMGVKTKTKNDSITIYGNPNLKINKNIVIKNFLKDHRVFMTCVISALSFGGNWKIYDPDSTKTSFPSFFKTIKELQS